MDKTIAGKLITFTLAASLAATGLAVHASPVSDGGKPKHGEWMLKKLDRNEDGSIDREEYRAPAARHFAALDADGDGQITEAEFTAHADKRFGKIDADGDGRLSADELREAGHDKRKMMKHKHRQDGDKR